MFSLSRDRSTTAYKGGLPPFTGTSVTSTGRGVESLAPMASTPRHSSRSEAFGYSVCERIAEFGDMVSQRVGLVSLDFGPGRRMLTRLAQRVKLSLGLASFRNHHRHRNVDREACSLERNNPSEAELGIPVIGGINVSRRRRVKAAQSKPGVAK